MISCREPDGRKLFALYQWNRLFVRNSSIIRRWTESVDACNRLERFTRGSDDRTFVTFIARPLFSAVHPMLETQVSAFSPLADYLWSLDAFKLCQGSLKSEQFFYEWGKFSFFSILLFNILGLFPSESRETWSTSFLPPSCIFVQSNFDAISFFLIYSRYSTNGFPD